MARNGTAVRKLETKSTLIPFGLAHNQTIEFILRDGRTWKMTLVATSAEVIAREYAAYGYHDSGHASGDCSDRPTLVRLSLPCPVNGGRVQEQLLAWRSALAGRFRVVA